MAGLPSCLNCYFQSLAGMSLAVATNEGCDRDVLVPPGLGRRSAEPRSRGSRGSCGSRDRDREALFTTGFSSGSSQVPQAASLRAWLGCPLHSLLLSSARLATYKNKKLIEETQDTGTQAAGRRHGGTARWKQNHESSATTQQQHHVQ